MYRTIDLCAGIGGMRCGFEMTGQFRTVASAEIDKYAIGTYEHLFPNSNAHNDLTSERFKTMLEQPEYKYDVLLAGFPCQPFSSAGEQKGFEDEDKGTIFFHIAEIIKRTRPKAIFLENVQNLVSHDKKKTIKKIITTLEEDLNYKIIGITQDDNGEYVFNNASFVRNTRFFGLPQNRPRAYIMAFDRNLYGSAVIEQLVNELPNPQPGEIPCLDVRQILEPQVDIHYYMSAAYLQTLEEHIKKQHSKGNGFGYCVINHKDRNLSYANTILATGGSGKERNLVEQPMPQYDSKDPVIQKIISRKKNGLNQKNIRVMTPTEWGRLQGFIGYGFIDPETDEDRFSFPDGMPEGQKYKQFGNAVSIPVIRRMAEFMLDCFQVLTADTERLVQNYIRINGYITRSEWGHLFNVTDNQAGYQIRECVRRGIIHQIGQGRTARYVL